MKGYAYLFAREFIKELGKGIRQEYNKEEEEIEYEDIPPAEFARMKLVDTKAGDIRILNDQLYHKSLICMTLGRRGSGKSAFTFRLAENISAKSERPIYTLNYPKPEVLPPLIDNIDELEEAERGGVVIVDEGAVAFSARRSISKENKNLTDLMAIARHRNITLLIVTQNSALSDLNIMRLADILFLKEPSLLQTETERGFLKKLYEKIQPYFGSMNENDEYVSKGKKVNQPKTYVFSDHFRGLIESGLASFWNEDISEAWG